MNKHIQPANQLAANYGVKAVISGPAGSGKTPLISTAPRAIVLALEPGYKSVRNMDFPCWNAINNLKAAEEFFEWLMGSSEAKAYDTVGFDSWSQLCELVLEKAKRNNSHGLKAYGVMSEQIMKWANQLFYMPQKHVVMLCKAQVVEMPGPGNDPIQFRRPYFPGRELIVQIPHLYDEFWWLDKFIVPGVNGKVSALLTNDRSDTLVRSRSGTLSQYEPPNLTEVFAKAMR